jgi:hypothetical protein
MVGGAFLAPDSGAEITARRVESILRVAGAHRTGVAVGALTELLPAEGPRSEADLAEWLRAHPSVGTLVGSTAFAPSSPPVTGSVGERRARGDRYWRRAADLAAGDLRPVHRLLLSMAVTGSAAYGEPEAGDDLDLLAITRTDSVWVFLAFTYLRLRLRSDNVADADSGPCFNYVMDERTAWTEYAGSRGLLFAREALTARPVLGEAYYRQLLHSASWMGDELPRLFARWELPRDRRSDPAPRAPLALRIVNAFLFPWIAAYLQAQGLMRNRAYRRSGQSARAFRTFTHYRKLCFASARFESLRRHYEGSRSTSRSEA